MSDVEVCTECGDELDEDHQFERCGDCLRAQGGRIASWIIGAFLLFIGVAALTLSIISGALLLVAGVIVLPPVRRRFPPQVKPVTGRTSLFSIVVGVLFIAGLATAPSGAPSGQPSADAFGQSEGELVVDISSHERTSAYFDAEEGHEIDVYIENTGSGYRTHVSVITPGEIPDTILSESVQERAHYTVEIPEDGEYEVQMSPHDDRQENGGSVRVYLTEG